MILDKGTRQIGWVLLVALTVAVAGCTGGTRGDDGEGDDGADGGGAPASGDAPAAASSPVTFTASEYAFEGPGTIAAGWTTFLLENGGTELHHAQLVALDNGYSVDEYLHAMERTLAGEAPPPEWATGVGGPNAASPFETTNATLDLTPGTYVVLCLIPDAEGVPHVANGMATSFNVTAATHAVEEKPVEDVVLPMYEFAFGSFTTGPGRTTFKAVNEGTQDHEATLFKLQGNATGADFLEWLAAPDGPPPGKGYGGVVGIAPGGENWFSVDLTPGNYAFVCFLPDPGSGKEHVELGMMLDFTVDADEQA